MSGKSAASVTYINGIVILAKCSEPMEWNEIETSLTVRKIKYYSWWMLGFLVKKNISQIQGRVQKDRFE